VSKHSRLIASLSLFAGIGLLFGLPTTGHVARAATSELTLTQAIEQIPVKGRAPKTGYERAQFGQTWADVNRNGCDTRNDILGRDLTEKTFKPRTRNCVVLSGDLLDPYSGTLIHFLRGEKTSNEVQIDHIVSLSNAWQTGAFKLTNERRTALANDPLELLAVKGSLNLQKSDGDAATWLPPLKSYRCAFVARQIAVKYKYGLWLTPPEKAVIVSILDKCPNQALPN
jgi:hypothetical protein